MTHHGTLDHALAELLEAGAVLGLVHPDGTAHAHSWPLARQHRIDDDVLWLRTLISGHRTPAGTPVFPLGDCLRRGIALDSYTVDANEIRFELGSGQVLELRPATSPRELETLELWDVFTLTVLTAQEEDDLDRLDADSWQGRFI